MIKVTMGYVESEEGPAMVDNDRGEWKLNRESNVIEFLGFGSENSLVVIPMSMQSGIWDVVVVHSRVDSYSKVVHRSGRNLDAVVNQCIAEVYTS